MIQKGGQCGRHHGLMQLKDSLNRNGSAVPDRRSFLQLCSFIFRDGRKQKLKHLTYAYKTYKGMGSYKLTPLLSSISESPPMSYR